MDNIRFSIIGGDLRNVKLANLLAVDNYKVSIYGSQNKGLEIGIDEPDNLNSLIAQGDVIIGPMPCCLDNLELNMPYSKEKIKVQDVFKSMTNKQIFLAGLITPDIDSIAKQFNINCIDLLKREEMAVLNAIPTAEGAIQIAIQEMPITLHGCNAMVLGFGRIGKVLTKMLNGLGCSVFAEARKYSDIAWIRSYGYTPILLSKLSDYVGGMDVIFNTIPSLVLDSILLRKIEHDCLIIDLASRPGGVNFERANELGIKTVWALSLPGIVAPITAAKYLKDTIYNIVFEMEEGKCLC